MPLQQQIKLLGGAHPLMMFGLILDVIPNRRDL
jgi:hypothetical protein